MSDFYILDENHKAVPCKNITEWGFMFQKDDRVVKKTNIPTKTWKWKLGMLLGIKRWQPVLISTVFVGINHNFLNDKEPLLFETMVFGGEMDQEMDRYSTWRQAEKGHEEMIRKVKHISHIRKEKK